MNSIPKRSSQKTITLSKEDINMTWQLDLIDTVNIRSKFACIMTGNTKDVYHWGTEYLYLDQIIEKILAPKFKKVTIIHSSTLTLSDILPISKHLQPQTALVFTNIEHCLENKVFLREFLHLAERSVSMRQQNNFLLGTTMYKEKLPAELLDPSTRIREIQIPEPQPSEIGEFIGYHQQRAQDDPSIPPLDLADDLDVIVRSAKGMTLRGIYDVRRSLAARKQPLAQQDILNQKAKLFEQLNCSGTLIFTVSKTTFTDIGGLKLHKQYLKYVAKQVLSQRPTAPQALLFVGPPGTGKTFLAHALANELGFTFCLLGDIFSKWVGESERRMTWAVTKLRQFSPICLFIDELDLAFSGRNKSGDGGASHRVFKKLMEFLGSDDLRGQVLVIAASNRPDHIDSALLRAGRFTHIIPFFLPTTAEKIDIVRKFLVSRQISHNLSSLDFQQLALTFAGPLTASEIVAIMLEAYDLSLNSEQPLTLQDVKTAQQKLHMRPHDDYHLMEKLARQHCTLNTFLSSHNIQEGGSDVSIINQASCHTDLY